MLRTAEAAGIPKLDADELAAGSLTDMSEVLPPKGRTLIASTPDGTLLGCGQLRRIREDAVEIKRVFVQPESQGTGLGRDIFLKLIEEARHMGMAEVYADTVKGNTSMMRIFERTGFEYIDRYPENYNPPEYAPFVVYVRMRLT